MVELAGLRDINGKHGAKLGHQSALPSRAGAGGAVGVGVGRADEGTCRLVLTSTRYASDAGGSFVCSKRT